jgi:hypothetical protein
VFSARKSFGKCSWVASKRARGGRRHFLSWGLAVEARSPDPRLGDGPSRDDLVDAGTHLCTTSIRWHVKHVNPDAPPFDWRLIANGYGDQLMYERGTVDTSLPFAELRARSLVNAKANGADQDPAFSTRIREGLPDPRSHANSRGR